MAKKQTTKTPEGVKKSPFKSVSENLPFHNFDEQPNLICQVNGTLTLGGEKKEAFDVFKVTDILTGEQKFVTSSYAIKHCVEKAKMESKETSIPFADWVFNFEFKGRTTVDGHPFNKFDTGYCTLEEYQDSL